MKTFVALFFALAISGLDVWAGDRIVINGSDTLGAKLVPLLCEAYKAKKSDCSFEISSPGSHVGGLLEGNADLLMFSRELHPRETALIAERGLTLEQHTAACDAFAIIVHETNPVSDLTRKQVEAIFTGDVKNWREVGGRDEAITIFTRNTSSGAFAAFRAKAMSGREYAQNAQKMAGGDSISTLVAQTPSGISYVGSAYLKARGLKPLRIDGFSCAEEHRNQYPYVAPLYYLLRRPAHPAARQFVEWATKAPEAMKIIRQTGFFPPP